MLQKNGFGNVIARQSVYARFRKPISHFPLLTVEGEVQRETAMTNVLCHRVAILDIILTKTTGKAGGIRKSKLYSKD